MTSEPQIPSKSVSIYRSIHLCPNHSEPTSPLARLPPLLPWSVSQSNSGLSNLRLGRNSVKLSLPLGTFERLWPAQVHIEVRSELERPMADTSAELTLLTSLPPQPVRPSQWDTVTPAANGHARPAEPIPHSSQSGGSLSAANLPGERQSLSGISLRAFALGLAFGLSASASLYLLLSRSLIWRSPFFLAILSLFHFLEFFTTARYNTAFATTSAFLLSSNGVAYNAAHTLAMLETTISHYLLPYPSYLPDLVGSYLLFVGFVLLILGQLTRSMAMAQAGKNFNHTVQIRKAAGHQLVTTGIYSVLRHPSYFGFFWWGLGSQIVLGNPICFAAYSVVLWKFFSVRIRSTS